MFQKLFDITIKKRGALFTTETITHFLLIATQQNNEEIIQFLSQYTIHLDVDQLFIQSFKGNSRVLYFLKENNCLPNTSFVLNENGKIRLFQECVEKSVYEFWYQDGARIVDWKYLSLIPNHMCIFKFNPKERINFERIEKVLDELQIYEWFFEKGFQFTHDHIQSLISEKKYEPAAYIIRKMGIQDDQLRSIFKFNLKFLNMMGLLNHQKRKFEY